MQIRVLMLDDDERSLRAVGRNLVALSMLFLGECEPARLTTALEEFRPDVVILDRRFPQHDGLDLLKQVRLDERYSNLPVIIVSGKNSAAARAEGLDKGADDYLGKPFSYVELAARIRALARRGVRETLYADGILRIGDNRTLWIDGKFLEISGRPWLVLKSLVLARGPLCREQILEELGMEVKDGRYIDRVIQEIRELIEVHPSHTYIRTVRQIGYQFCPFEVTPSKK